MGFLKFLYPRALQLEKKVTKPFVIKLVVYVIIGIVASIVLAAPAVILILCGLGNVAEIVGGICGGVGSLVGLYLTGGIVVSILKFVGVIKDEAVQSANVPNNAFTNAAGKVGNAFGKVVDTTTNAVNTVVDKVTEDKKDDKEDNKDEE